MTDLQRKYYQSIHIAKKNLGLDDDLYREVLHSVTGKSSCKDMDNRELNRVLVHMQNKGFKVEKSKKYSAQLNKLRSIWIEMDKAGYLENGTDAGLLNWSKSQAKRLNGNVEIERLEWIKPNMLSQLIEQLKQWHRRLGNAEREKNAIK